MEEKKNKIVSRAFAAFLVLLLWQASVAQVTVNMTNGSTTTCSGDFYDSGGSGGNYMDNETYTFTICSNNGQSPYLNFSSFNIENSYDHLYIYDGPNATYPLLGSYTGTGSPGTVGASGTCLTVVFTSDGSVNYAGWAATITCGAPAPPPATAPSNCASADPFCTGTTYTFPATTGATAETGPSYGCLFSQPNPAWYYMQIANSGNIVISIAGTGGYDVDFICWGPFTSPTAPCTAQLTGSCATNHSCSGNIVDCSYSSSATETCTIPSGVAGQYYMILITNFSNQVQNITFNQSGGTGSTNCNIVCPVPTVNTATICTGGSAVLTATGGSTSYTWTPSTGLSTTSGSVVTASPTVTTTYSVVGTGTCTSAPVTTTVTVSPPPAVTVASQTICLGNSTTLTASGATTYSWSPATGLSATTGASVTANPTVTTVYTVTGTTGSCVGTKTCNVTVNPNPVVTVNSATICRGSSTTLTASGATTYSWSPSTGLSATTGASVTANPTVTTTYTITGTTGTCTSSATSIVTVNPLPTVTVNSPSICAGGSTTLNASGATTYSWTPSTGLSATTGASVTANPASTTVYTVTGTTSGCSGTASATVTVNPNPVVTVNSTTMCPGSTATLTASGASTYTWSPSGTLSASTGASVQATPTVTTVYTITATSASGCTATATSTVTIGGSISPTVNSATICAGTSTTLSATGGTTYTWSPATGLSSTSGATVTANPASTTTYTLTAGSGGCTGTTTCTVTVNPLPPITVNSASICAGSSTTLNASGATTYSWSPATGLSGTTGASVTANPTSTTTYTVVGTSLTCTAQATAVVTVNPMPTITVNNATICNGGSATLTASGASTYTWSPATGLSATTGASVTANPPSTTTYTITGTTAAGCVSTQTTSVTVVTNPTVTVPSATICTGNSTTLTASGAATYVWSPATGLSATSGSSVVANPTSTTVYTITGTAGTCTAVNTTTVTVNPLPVVGVNSATICVGQQIATLTATGGSSYTWTPSATLSSANGSPVTATPTITTSYTVTATDANGCVNSNTATVTVNSLPVITANNGFICNGSSITLTASGATTYTWSPGTGLSSTNGSSVTASPASTTQYTITATDANGCVNSDTTTVTVVSNPTVTVPSTTICTGSSTTLTATGAVTYVWSPGVGLSATTGSSVVANPTSTMVYTITGTAGTCTAVTTTTVNVNPLPVVTPTSNSPLCVNQNLSLASSTGVSYNWSGPNSFSATAQNTGITSVTQANAGVYTVTVTDTNGCVNSGTVSVTVNPLPVVVATGATVCVGQTINLSTNNSGVIYSWMGPNSFSSNQQNPSIVNAATNMSGSYVVTVTDVNGCASGNVANVQVNPSLVITAGSNSPVCENGTLNLTSNSGVSWSWSGPGGFTAFSQNGSIPSVQLSAGGMYVVTGTDQNGCQGKDSVNVVINPLPVITANSGTICVTQQTAPLTAAGASTYTWAPASSLNSSTGTTVIASPMVTTIYTITGTDTKGCVNTGTTSVVVNQLPTVSSNSGVICLGNSTTLNGAGANTYTWTPTTGLSSATGSVVTASPTSTTGYTVTGTDINGCVNTGVCTVTVNPLPVVTVNSGTICIGKTTSLTANGANTYNWTPTSGLSSSTGATVSANPTSTSTYSVIGTDINGCKDTAIATVTVNALPALNVGPQLSSGCSPVCVTLTNSTVATGTFAWNMGDGTTSSSNAPYHCYSGQGTFNAVLTLTDANGCVSADTAVITVFPIPNADFNFGPQPTTIFDPSITFTDATTNAVISNWNWTFGDPLNSTATTQNTSFTYADPGTYPVTLIVASDHNCTDTVSKTVVIAEDFMIYVPNAFTPNFDGVNDYFTATGEGIKSFKLYIFDRWGNQVYYTEDITRGWDGRYMAKGNDIMQEDVYVWKIELKNFKGEPRLLKGTVTLIK